MTKKSLPTPAPSSNAGLCWGWIPLHLHRLCPTPWKIREQNPDFYFSLYFSSSQPPFAHTPRCRLLPRAGEAGGDSPAGAPAG